MPVIVMASPKGGVGKSTVSVLLATGFARLGAEVTIIDTDPNRSLSRWASHGLPWLGLRHAGTQQKGPSVCGQRLT